MAAAAAAVRGLTDITASLCVFTRASLSESRCVVFVRQWSRRSSTSLSSLRLITAGSRRFHVLITLSTAPPGMLSLSLVFIFFPSAVVCLFNPPPVPPVGLLSLFVVYFLGQNTHAAAAADCCCVVCVCQCVCLAASVWRLLGCVKFALGCRSEQRLVLVRAKRLNLATSSTGKIK